MTAASHWAPFSSFHRAPRPPSCFRSLPSFFPYTSEPGPCLTLLKNHGPIIQTPHRSRMICTFGRRLLSPGNSSPRFSTVCQPTDLFAQFSPTLLVRPIALGIVIVIFFRCITALFNPANRTREGTKWPLIIYTVLMFSLVTVRSAMTLNLMSVSFIDNREFHDVGDRLPPGPIGYMLSAQCLKAIGIIPNLTFLLNNWLADGLLVCFSLPFTRPEASHRLLVQLYRCYVIYAMNLWAIVFPSLMYLGSLGAYLTPPHVDSAPG